MKESTKNKYAQVGMHKCTLRYSVKWKNIHRCAYCLIKVFE